ncbi:MAG: hypothetical protein CMB45_02990 [Euryarchaeota archaeon]|nr:hypothetical protein [Euryarchaeota archaeon]
MKEGGVLGWSRAQTCAGSIGDKMGVIFRDDYDDQQDSLMKSIAIGNTWQFRIFKIKALLWGTLASVTTGGVALVIDYAFYKLSDSPNIIAWLLG